MSRKICLRIETLVFLEIISYSEDGFYENFRLRRICLLAKNAVDRGAGRRGHSKSSFFNPDCFKIEVKVP